MVVPEQERRLRQLSVYHMEAPSSDSHSHSKDSSENAIFSIYSMYGDEHNVASTSWADPLRTKRSSEGPDLAYYSTLYSDTEPPLISMPVQCNSKNTSPCGSVVTSSSTRPPSSYATPAHSDLFEDSRLANSSNLRTSDLSASSYTPAPSQSKELRRSGSLHSKRSSRSSPPLPTTREEFNRDLPPLPPSVHPTPSPTPPRQSSPFLSPKSSMQLHGKHVVPPVSSPSSKVSLVPSEGEDMDAFHVRNTYAQLEASGVKGDGYEEGVERTRARIGTSRMSQLQAAAALGDGKEKTRDLDEKEVQVLKSVDRCVFSISIPHPLISKKITSATDSFLFHLMTDWFCSTLHLSLSEYLL